jgi:hypothetical protein
MKTLFTFILLTICFNSIAQEADKTVSITVSGSGKTQDEAKQSALRSAIEQAFGAFISSKTEILNDQVVADQMASVSSGNIKSFTILNESQLPDGSWGVTLKAVVSVSKLTSFVEAKGIEIEIKGGLFAINIKQQILNEQAEVNAISEMIGLLHEPMQTAFDYTIKSGEPKAMDDENTYWKIPLIVTSIANKNMDFCANYFIKTLSALSLSKQEVESYEKLNKATYKIELNYLGIKNTFFLRKQISKVALNSFGSNWEFYTGCFKVKRGNKSLLLPQFNSYPRNTDYFKEIFKIHKFNLESENQNINFHFLTIGQEAGKYHINEELKLNEIEQMSGYSVKPTGIISQFKNGGYVVFEKNGKGLVAAVFDLNATSLETAKRVSENLNLNGYDDWRLPTNEERKSMFLLKFLGIGGFSEDIYWASTKGNYSKTESLDGSSYVDLEIYQGDGITISGYPCRAVRSF